MNRNLHRAKRAKNDEFYTQLIDIEKELIHYQHHFKNKIVLCNCRDNNSEFKNYFTTNFDQLGLKKLITTDGDFRSEECIELLKQSDIVVTNPPFSLFREYIAQLIKYEKKFLILGNYNAVTYREIFPLIKENRMWLGVSLDGRNIWFGIPDSYEKYHKIEDGKKFAFVAGVVWFTNLPHKKRNEELILVKKYEGNEEEYPKYDNYDAIEVSKVVNIPKDYDGVMGVPITFLNKYNPEQFEIVGSNRGIDQDPNGIYGRGSFLNGKETFKRLFIKKR